MKNDKKKNIPHKRTCPFTKQTGHGLPWVMIHPFNKINERLQQLVWATQTHDT
jgi:hypothetical protein